MARDLAVDHLTTILVMAVALFFHSILAAFSAQGELGEPVQTLTLQRGNISALLRDNALSPGLLSGIDSLFNRVDAPEFDAFDPDDRGASAGLNFEHVICGQSNS